MNSKVTKKYRLSGKAFNYLSSDIDVDAKNEDVELYHKLTNCFFDLRRLFYPIAVRLTEDEVRTLKTIIEPRLNGSRHASISNRGILREALGVLNKA